MWPKLVVLFLMIGWYLPAMAQAKSIENPLAHYLASEAYQGFARYDPNTNVSRGDVDINGDGNKVVFLAANYVRHGGYCWTCYLPGKRGYTVGLLSPRESEMLAFTQYNAYVGYIREIKHRGIVFFQGRVVDGFEFFAFWVEDGKARIKKIGSVKGADTDVPTKPEPLFRKYFPDLQATSEHPPFDVETMSPDELRAKGYAIPKIGK
jgi:hypothetical protein